MDEWIFCLKLILERIEQGCRKNSEGVGKMLEGNIKRIERIFCEEILKELEIYSKGT